MDYQKAVQLYREDMIRDIQEMIGIPSKKGAPEAGAPFGKELRRMLDWMLEKAVNDGYEVKEYWNTGKEVRSSAWPVTSMSFRNRKKAGSIRRFPVRLKTM